DADGTGGGGLGQPWVRPSRRVRLGGAAPRALVLVAPFRVIDSPKVEASTSERRAFSWSVSRHDSFQSCRRRYFLSYYASLDDPEVRRLKRLSALPMWVGSVVPETIEAFLKAHDT